MSDELTPFVQSCLMSNEDVIKVGSRISSSFPQIRIIIKAQRESDDSLCVQRIPEGETLVTFEIPRTDIFMPDFYREIREALNQGQIIPTQKEREI